jgi:hypothetical protein
VFRVVLLSAMSALMMTACASSKFKERQAQREKVASSAGLYCEFISGDVYPDLDVELNMKMAQRCDARGSLSITNYKNTSDQNGIMYCCAMNGPQRDERRPQPPPRKTPVKDVTPAASPAAGAPAKSNADDDVLSEN